MYRKTEYAWLNAVAAVGVHGNAVLAVDVLDNVVIAATAVGLPNKLPLL